MLEPRRVARDHRAVRSPPHHLVIALLSGLAACGHPPQPVKLTLGPQRELLVQAEVNGEPAILELDTGASTTSFVSRAKPRLHLRGFMPTAGAGAGGTLAHAGWVYITKLVIAGETLRGLGAVLLAGGGGHGAIDGLLGMDVLGDFALEVDLRAMRVVLHDRGDTSFVGPDLVATDYRALPGGQVALEVTVAGHPATAVLDLGANRTFANRRTGLAPDDDHATISAAIGADRNRLTFHAASDVAIAVGPLTLEARSVWINDLPIFQTFGLADRPALVLGTDVLAGRRIVIDPFRHRVYVSRGGP